MAIVFKAYDTLNSTTHVRQKNGYVTSGSDFKKPTPSYFSAFGSTSAKTSWGQVIMPANDTTVRSKYWPKARTTAVARAIGDFKESMYKDKKASFGIAFAQWDQTLGMMSKRLHTLNNFARKIPGASIVLVTGDYFRRKAALKQLARSLNHPSNSADMQRLYKRSGDRWREIIRTPGDLWLEFWFGWSATVSDLKSGADVLADPAPLMQVVKGGGAGFEARSVFTPGSNGTFHYTRYEAKVFAGVSGTVTVTNPNLYLANRLGLINLASVAWDAIPFSWVVGFFGNFQEFLESLTWDAGASVPMSTRFTGTRAELSMERFGVWRNPTTGKTESVRGASKVYIRDRLQGWSGNVKLTLRAPIGNATRCLSLGSVLLQKLSTFSTPIQYRRA